MAGLDPSALSQVNSCKLPEKLASTPFIKTIDAVGTPTILKSGVCRVEYDMGPSLENFSAFLNSPQHDPLKLNIRNRKITQLLYIGEKGELPQNFDRHDWIGTALSRMSDPLVRQGYSPDHIKEIARSLIEKIYPDIRTVPGFKVRQLEQKPKPLDTIHKKGTDDTRPVRRAVPSIRPERAKRSPSI